MSTATETPPELESSSAPPASKPVSAAGWRKRNDSGPHTATFPSGAVLKFVIPDSGALLRSGRLPENLRETALLCAAHPDGPEGYMSELVTAAIVAGDRAERSATVTKAISDGMELGHVLIAEMLVEPKVTPEEVARGDFPELDVKMLLEFAERRRNTDALGHKVPVVILAEWARFRDEPLSDLGARDGDAGRHDARGDVPDAHDDPGV